MFLIDRINRKDYYTQEFLQAQRPAQSSKNRSVASRNKKRSPSQVHLPKNAVLGKCSCNAIPVSMLSGPNTIPYHIFIPFEAVYHHPAFLSNHSILSTPQSAPEEMPHLAEEESHRAHVLNERRRRQRRRRPRERERSFLVVIICKTRKTRLSTQQQ